MRCGCTRTNPPEAERATDPRERQRLKDRARRLKPSGHAGGTGKPDIDSVL
ncbi:DUF6381 family protein [Streptomyces sp. NPDC056002]|uniref:DUF6381 family protein n=1 Tax=Streptomyces sp. NPDC056002 TaxID=3345675 RepID=UPI0035E09D4E